MDILQWVWHVTLAHETDPSSDHLVLAHFGLAYTFCNIIMNAFKLVKFLEQPSVLLLLLTKRYTEDVSYIIYKTDLTSSMYHTRVPSMEHV